jgi:hypothetical protein
MSIADILGKVKDSDLTRKLLPAGTYVARIDPVEVMKYFWPAKKDKPNRFGLSYVPTLRLRSIIETGDEELDRKNASQLEAFGDWRAFKMVARYTKELPGFSEPVRLAGVSAVNFTLVETTPNWEDYKQASPQLWRFYQNQDGEQDGFVTKLSRSEDSFEQIELPSIDIPAADALQLLIPATEGSFLEIDISIESSERGNNNVVVDFGPIS